MPQMVHAEQVAKLMEYEECRELVSTILPEQMNRKRRIIAEQWEVGIIHDLDIRFEKTALITEISDSVRLCIRQEMSWNRDGTISNGFR